MKHLLPMHRYAGEVTKLDFATYYEGNGYIALPGHPVHFEGDVAIARAPLSLDEQYKKIEPDTVTAVLVERGWYKETDPMFVRDLPYPFDVDVWMKNGLTIHIKDGDQREALAAVFDYEGPEAVTEIYLRSID